MGGVNNIRPSTSPHKIIRDLFAIAQEDGVIGKEIARRMDVVYEDVSYLKHNKRKALRIRHVEKLAEALGCELIVRRKTIG